MEVNRCDYDLIVAGGGPAGTAAAITAAASGARVLLLERGRLPRHKVCGEFVSSESLELLTRLLGGQHAALLRDATRISQARVFLDGRRLESAITPAAASVARLDLDGALWDSATKAGVDARQQTMVNGVTGGGPFRVTTSAGNFECRALINASGRWSNLRPSSADNGKLRERWVGIKGHFAESAPHPSVDLYFFEGGYCGVQPVDVEGADLSGGRVNACAMVRADVASTLPEVFLQHKVLRERSRSWWPLCEPVSTSPLIFGKPQPERDGVLLAGDAAGFVDPFVGDGISLALRGGALAARCVVPFLAGEIPWEEVTRRYGQKYQTDLAPVFHASSRIRRMLGLPSVLRKPLLFFLGGTPAMARYAIRKTR